MKFYLNLLVAPCRKKKKALLVISIHIGNLRGTKISLVMSLTFQIFKSQS